MQTWLDGYVRQIGGDPDLMRQLDQAGLKTKTDLDRLKAIVSVTSAAQNALQKEVMDPARKERIKKYINDIHELDERLFAMCLILVMFFYPGIGKSPLCLRLDRDLAESFKDAGVGEFPDYEAFMRERVITYIDVPAGINVWRMVPDDPAKKRAGLDFDVRGIFVDGGEGERPVNYVIALTCRDLDDDNLIVCELPTTTGLVRLILPNGQGFNAKLPGLIEHVETFVKLTILYYLNQDGLQSDYLPYTSDLKLENHRNRDKQHAIQGNSSIFKVLRVKKPTNILPFHRPGHGGSMVGWVLGHEVAIEPYQAHRWKGTKGNLTLEPVKVSGYTKGPKGHKKDPDERLVMHKVTGIPVDEIKDPDYESFLREIGELG